jgi:putative ATP-binding cassette transporter
MRFFHRPLWSRLTAVGLPFFRSGLRGRALGGLALLAGLLLTVNGLNVVNSYVGRDAMTGLEQRSVVRFYSLALALAGVFAASTVVEVLARYVEQRLGVLWREWLTRHFLDRYLAGRSYHRLGERGDIDNPDQRISQDVQTITASTLSFLILLFNAVLTFIAFAGVLWSITPWLFAAAVGYAILGTTGTILLGRRLVGLNNLQLKKEADFRYALVRLREHSGDVAQLAGEPGESSRLRQRLGAVVENFRAIVVVSRNLGFFTSLYNYLPQILPALIVAPLYIRGQVLFGTVTQSAMAFSQLLGAFSLIVTQFQQLSAYAAVVSRLGSLWEATAPGPAVPPAAPPTLRGPAVDVEPGGTKVTYEGVTLRAPGNGRPLVKDLTLEVPQGQRLAVTGPSGAGKTALLLATAGLWNEGQGHIVRPGGVMFLPQRPYVTAGRLRDLLLYGLPPCEVSDERLLAVLAEVDLGALAARAADLDVERNWPKELSEGQRQALACARLLLACPRFAFLDGAAVPDGSHAERLYTALERTAITFISVGDHPAVLRHHDQQLELHGDGSWQLQPAKVTGHR